MVEDLECKFEHQKCKFEHQKSSLDEVKAQNREDFMKRWFAIALSVGFATALARMPWIENQRIFMTSLPIDWHQTNQLMRLVAAGVATILSWEGYLLSIRTKPLKDAPRFYIDVFLVTLYLVLLLTSSSPYLWVGIHCLAFLIYIFWDFLSVEEHPAEYIKANSQNYKSRGDIYAGVMRGSEDIYHGPIVTLTWPIYLATLAATYYLFFDRVEKESPIVTALYMILVLYGLYGYRNAKRDETSNVRQRIMKVAAISCIAALLGRVDIRFQP